MKRFLQQYRLACFFGLTFALSWYPWILALVRGRTSGPNPLGPLLAGILMTALLYGRSGLREFFGRIVRGRVAARWYAVALIGPACLLSVAAALTLCFGDRPEIAGLTPARLRELPDRFLFILLFIGLGEEPGWRGFALPQLQAKHSPLISSLILAPFWALWHLPLMGNEFPWPVVPAFLLSICGGTLLQTWLFNASKGSVLLVMLFHATVNTLGAGLIFPLFCGHALLLLWWIYGAICFGLGFTVLLVRPRGSVEGAFASGVIVASRGSNAPPSQA